MRIKVRVVDSEVVALTPQHKRSEQPRDNRCTGADNKPHRIPMPKRLLGERHRGSRRRLRWQRVHRDRAST